MLTGRINYGTNPLFLADIARVDAQAIYAALRHGKRNFVVKVNVRNQRDFHLFTNFTKGFGSFDTGNRNADDVSPRVLQVAYLIYRCRNIHGLCVGHTLHANRRITAHSYGADHYLARLATNNWRFSKHFRDSPTRSAIQWRR